MALPTITILSLSMDSTTPRYPQPVPFVDFHCRTSFRPYPFGSTAGASGGVDGAFGDSVWPTANCTTNSAQHTVADVVIGRIMTCFSQ